MSNNKLKILLAGDGSGGPIVPLLAVAEQIKELHPDAIFLLVGTSELGKKFAEKNNMDFAHIPVGKWHRYFTFKNFLTPFLTIAGFLKSLRIVKQFSPDLIFSAGGAVAVPIGFAGYLLRKKQIIHQQDILATLTNKILAPFATKITVTFESSASDFYTGSGLFGFKDKITVTGNPIRKEIINLKIENAEAKKHLGFNNDLPLFLFLGGGTGALGLNKIILESLPELVQFCNVLHSTGIGKAIVFKHPNYKQYCLIENMPEAYAAANFVVSRAGLSTISELSALQKVAVIVPMPNSHQLYNGLYLDQHQAALVVNQESLEEGRLVLILRRLLYDLDWQKDLSANIGAIMPHNAAQKIAKIILDLCRK